MTIEEKRIKIAEACGWRREWVSKDRHIQQWVCRRPDGTVDYCDPDPDATWETHRLPDYLTDLNAIHEAEKTLKRGLVKYGGQWRDYENRLWVVVNGSLPFDKANSDEFANWISATAAQRAEAFGQTLKLWT